MRVKQAKNKATSTPGVVTRIELSAFNCCAKEKFCYSPSRKRSINERWIAERDLFVDSNRRVFVLVDTETHVFFMDAITGSLYTFGDCVGSDTLKLKGLRRDDVQAAKILLAFQPARAEGDIE